MAIPSGGRAAMISSAVTGLGLDALGVVDVAGPEVEAGGGTWARLHKTALLANMFQVKETKGLKQACNWCIWQNGIWPCILDSD